MAPWQWQGRWAGIVAQGTAVLPIIFLVCLPLTRMVASGKLGTCSAVSRGKKGKDLDHPILERGSDEEQLESRWVL